MAGARPQDAQRHAKRRQHRGLTRRTPGRSAAWPKPGRKTNSTAASSDRHRRAFPKEMDKRPAERRAQGSDGPVNRHLISPPSRTPRSACGFPPIPLACLSRRKRAQHQALSRTAEGALQQVAGKLPLGPFARLGWPHRCARAALVAPHQALFRHDLQYLQHRGVLRRLAADNASWTSRTVLGPAAPEHGQDFQFGVGGPRRIGVLQAIYEELLRRTSLVKGLLRRASAVSNGPGRPASRMKKRMPPPARPRAPN